MAQFFKPKSGKAKSKQVSKFSLTIDKQDHHGKGISFSTSPITIVDQAITGEQGDVIISKKSKKAQYGKWTSITKPSNYRIKPFCEFYGSCGGCNLQHVNATNGLLFKFEALNEYLLHNLKVEVLPWFAPILSNIHYEQAHSKNDAVFSDLMNESINSASSHNSYTQTAYRRRVKLAIDARNPNNLRIGFRQRNGANIVDINVCSIVSDSINEALLSVRNTLNASLAKQVGHIVLTEGATSTQIAFYLVRKPSQEILNLLLNCVKNHKQVCVIFLKSDLLGHSFINAKNEKVLDFQSQKKTNQVDAGSDNNVEINAIDLIQIEDMQGKETAIKPHHFLQINQHVNHQMLRRAKKWLDPNEDDILYDFFCGAGNFSISMAQNVKEVFGYEGVSEMLSQARYNAVLQSVNNCDFKTLDLSETDLKSQITMLNDSLVILDPSREGAHQLSEVLLQKQCKKILYISCNPNTFCRDATHLQSKYKLTKIACLDMFPFTEHLELMALFE